MINLSICHKMWTVDHNGPLNSSNQNYNFWLSSRAWPAESPVWKPTPKESGGQDDVGHCCLWKQHDFFVFSFNSSVTNLILQILQQKPSNNDEAGVVRVRK